MYEEIAKIKKNKDVRRIVDITKAYETINILDQKVKDIKEELQYLRGLITKIERGLGIDE